jgi:hypothetical protein
MVEGPCSEPPTFEPTTAPAQGKVVCDGVASWAKSKLYKVGDQCVLNDQLWSAVKKGRKTKPNSRKDKKQGK